MKYQPPYGITGDPNASYINGDPSIGRMGSIPPAAAFEYPMRELVACITNSLFVPSDGDLQQVAQAMRSQRMNYAEDTGSANVLSVAFQPAFTAYTLGLPIVVKVLNTNTGPATLNAGAGRIPIKKPNGAQLVAGDITAGGLAELVYDGASWQMINFGGTGGGATTINNFVILIPYTVDTGTVNNVVANFSPAITSISAGTIVMVKAANTNTGPTTININGLGARPIAALGSTAAWPFLPGDIQAGDIMILTYDGTTFWIVPNTAITANSTFNVGTNADIDNIFKALARKRIRYDVQVTIQMAIAIFTSFITYHVDAARILVKGTLRTSLPIWSNFAQSGSSAAARAADAATNLTMLRSRYGTEVQVPNGAFNNPGGAGIFHMGSGQITFQNILVTGSNTYDGTTSHALIGANGAESILLTGVSMWGSGCMSFSAFNNVSMWFYDSFVCASQFTGLDAGNGGSIYMVRSGVFGCAKRGVSAGTNGSIWLYQSTPGCTSNCNGENGCTAEIGGQVWIGGNAGAAANGFWDAYASSNGVLVTSATANVPNASPIVNQTGNLGGVNVGGG